MARPRTTSDEAILRAAARAIAQRGPAGLTLAAVAGEAGLAPATLVQRFGSKRGLLLAVAAQAESGTQAVFEQARQEHGSPLAAVLAALAEFAASVRTPRELANSLGFLQLDLTDPEFRQHAAGQARRMHEEITALITDAVASRELVEAVEPARLARSIQVAYNGVLILWAIAGEGALADILRTDIEQLIEPHRAYTGKESRA